MATVLTAAPAVEPVSLADVKAHLRIDTADEDGLLQSLILTSRLHIEVALGLALITQGWSCYFDRWPLALSGRGGPVSPTVAALALPIGPIRTIDSLKVYADDGTFVALALTGFAIDLASRPARMARRIGTQIPEPGRGVNGIEIALTAGFGATPADVPPAIRQAMLLLIAHWYEHRDPIEIGTDATRVPAAVSALLAPWAAVRL